MIWCGRDIVISVAPLVGIWDRCDWCEQPTPDPSIHLLYFFENGKLKSDIAAFDRTSFDDVLCKGCFSKLTAKDVVVRLIAATMAERG